VTKNSSLVSKIEEKKSQLKPAETNCLDHQSTIKLSEILSARNKLKKIDTSTMNKKKINTNNFETSLLSVLAKIRNANSDSEASDDEDSFE
jgi:hypothetical protein